MTLLYQDPCFLEHKTGRHPEQPARLARVNAHLAEVGLDSECTRPAWEPISWERLTRVHRPEYVRELEEFARRGGGYIEMDTAVSERSYEVALRAAGAVADATERVLRGEDQRALCLIRPPGHHALGTGAMGFCLFNGIAIAARTAIAELGIERALIVDWDVHHGNGTQETFWDDGRIAFLSIHRFPFYPGSGVQSETGAGPGLGKIVNIPLPFGTPVNEFHAAFNSQVERLAEKVKPELIFISAGFDAHRLDPIGSLGLEVEDFSKLTEFVMQIAQTHAKSRVVSVLEGGYNLDVLPHCVETHLRGLMAAPTAR